MADDLNEILERLDYCDGEAITVSTAIATFLKGNIETKTDRYSNGTLISARCQVNVPVAIRSRLGTTIHETRSCLDELAVRLAGRNGKLPKDVYFPIPKTRNYYADQAKKKLGKLAEADMLRIAALKANGDDDPFLFGMHELDRVRKHQRLTITAASAQGLNISEGRFYGGAIVKKPLGRAWEPVMFLDGPSDCRIDLIYSLEFREPAQLVGNEVSAAVMEFIRRVRAIVKLFK